MLITDLNDFNLQHIFECGQCFRWNCDTNGNYMGVVGNNVITAFDTDKGVKIDGADDDFLSEYFDLKRDYSKIKLSFNDDEILKKAFKYGYGIRLLKQDPWETTVSFIISANNNIPRIKKIIELLCANFGEKIKDEHYTFPSAEKLADLTAEDLGVIKSGFRAKYIIDAAKIVASGEIDLNSIYALPSNEGRTMLKKIKGVGDKVADCILLFAYAKYDVFPKDVWIKRILEVLYNVTPTDFEKFAYDKFGDLAGFAQQYLFFYGRDFL